MYISGQSSIESNIISGQTIMIDSDTLQQQINPNKTNQFDLFNLSARKIPNGFSGLIRVYDRQNKICNSPSYSYPYYIHLSDKGELIELRRIKLNYEELIHSRHTNGIEDPRIFMFRGEEWGIANCLGSLTQSHPGVNMMCIFKVTDPQPTFRLLTPPKDVNPLQPQKNWSPFEWNGRLMCEYSLKPHVIIEIDPETGLTTEVSRDKKILSNIQHKNSLRGGAPPILVNLEDELVYLGIGHTRIGSWNYVHFFYTFEPNPPFKLIKFSPVFKLDGPELIQFASGLSEYNGLIHVSYGVNDNSNRVSTFSHDGIIDILNTSKLDSTARVQLYLPLLASLTTIPPRMHNGEFKKCIDSLLQQVTVFDHIFVTIPRKYPRFPDYDGSIPEWLKQEPYSSKVTILRTKKDLGPVSKYTGVAEYLSSLSDKDPLRNGIIFVCDDDQEYHPRLTLRMLNTIQRNRLSQNKRSFVIQNRYNIVRYGSGGIIHGFVGLMVSAPALKNLLAFDRPPACRYVDDQYMSIYFARNNIPIFPSEVENYSEIYSVMNDSHEKNAVTPESLAAHGSRDEYVQELSCYFKCQFITGGDIKFDDL